MKFFLSSVSIYALTEENKMKELLQKGFKIELKKDSKFNTNKGYIEIKNLNNLLLFYKTIDNHNLEVKLQKAWFYGRKLKCKYELNIIRPETHIV